MPPHMQDLLAYGLGGGLVLAGAALLAWGRHLGRVVTMIGAAAAGYFLSSQMNIHYVPPFAMQMVFIFVMLAFGYVFERLIWGALAAILLACIAAAVQVRPVIDPPSFTTPLRIDEFASKMYEALLPAFPASWAGTGFSALLGALGVIALVFTVALFRPKWIRIVMVSMVGAATVAAGLALVVCQLLPAWWSDLWTHLAYVLAGAGALALAAMVIQFLGLAKGKTPKADKSKDKARKAPEKSPKEQEVH
jgi:hypothetical protein